MNEEFLHYLWKYRLLEPDLRTVGGDPLTVLHPGEHNHDGGPDFFNARIRIGSTTWAGNVEIHVNSSDWYRHKHQNDPAYDNVILHAVFENDAEVLLRNSRHLPTLVMNGFFPDYIFERYRNFLENRRWIPCEAVIGEMDLFQVEQYLPVIAVERLEEKNRMLHHSLEACQYDWEEAFYRNLARAFGFRINAEPVEMLAKSLPCGNRSQAPAPAAVHERKARIASGPGRGMEVPPAAPGQFSHPPDCATGWADPSIGRPVRGNIKIG